jgi:hypothetical protein
MAVYVTQQVVLRITHPGPNFLLTVLLLYVTTRLQVTPQVFWDGYGDYLITHHSGTEYK